MTVLIIIAAVIGLIVLLLNFSVRVFVSYIDGKADIRVKYLFVDVYPPKEKPERPVKAEKKPKRKADKADKKETPVSELTVTEQSEPEQSGPQPSDKTEASDAAGTAKAEASHQSNETEEQKTGSDSEKTGEKKEPLMTRINNLLDGLNEKKEAFQLLWELCFGPVKKLIGKIRIDKVVIDFAAADEDAYNAAMLYGKMNAAVWNAVGWLKALTHIKISSVKVDCLFDTPKEKTRYDGSFTVKLRPASLVNAIGKIGFGYLFHLKKYSPAVKAFKKNK